MANSGNGLESQPDELENTKTPPPTPVEGHGDTNYIDHILLDSPENGIKVTGTSAESLMIHVIDMYGTSFDFPLGLAQFKLPALYPRYRIVMSKEEKIILPMMWDYLVNAGDHIRVYLSPNQDSDPPLPFPYPSTLSAPLIPHVSTISDIWTIGEANYTVPCGRFITIIFDRTPGTFANLDVYQKLREHATPGCWSDICGNQVVADTVAPPQHTIVKIGPALKGNIGGMKEEFPFQYQLIFGGKLLRMRGKNHESASNGNLMYQRVVCTSQEEARVVVEDNTNEGFSLLASWAELKALNTREVKGKLSKLSYRQFLSGVFAVVG